MRRHGLEIGQKGVTLVEVALAVAIMGIFLAIVTQGFDFVPKIKKQGNMIEVEQEAQVLLHSIAEEVRNARTILSISSTTLVISVYDLSRGYDVNANPQIYVDIGTITYQFRSDPGETYLFKQVEYPNRSSQRKLLKNMLVAPSGANVNTYVFVHHGMPPPPASITCPCDQVTTYFRFQSGFHRTSPRTYNLSATVRSFFGT